MSRLQAIATDCSNSRERTYLLSDQGDGQCKKHGDYNQLAGYAHQGDPQGKRVPRVCTKIQYTKGVGERGREVLKPLKESIETGRRATIEEEVGSYLDCELRYRSFQSHCAIK